MKTKYPLAIKRVNLLSYFFIQKTVSGEQRASAYEAEPDERTLSAEDKGPSYTNIVSTLVYSSNNRINCFRLSAYEHRLHVFPPLGLLVSPLDIS